MARPCRYEPGVQRMYAARAEHYGVAVISAWPAKPRDRPKVEAGVLVAERWILARLRRPTLFSLDALNERICELLDELNQRTMRAYRASRAELFERLDRPELRALPGAPFAFGTWPLATVNYRLARRDRAQSLLGPIHARRREGRCARERHNGRRLPPWASRHGAPPRRIEAGKHTTLPEHMPASHRAHAEWSPSRFLRWGRKIRAGYRRADRRDNAESPPSRGELPVLSRHPAAGQAARP